MKAQGGIPKIPNFEHIFGDSPSQKRGICRVILDLFRGHRLKILLSLIVFVIKSAPLWVVPIVTAWIINLTKEPMSDDIYRKITIYGIALFFVIIQNVPTHMVYARLNNVALRAMAAGIRSALVRKLQQLSITYHKQIATGRLQSKFLRDIDAVNLMANSLLCNVLPAFIFVLVSLGISISHSLWMTLFFLLVVPANVAVARIFKKAIGSRFRMFRLENETVSNSFTTMLKMISVTRAHGLENNEIESFEKKVDVLTEKGLMADDALALFGSVIWILSQLLSAACLIITTILAIKGYVPVGDIVLYQSLFALINGHVNAIVSAYPTIMSGIEAMHSLSEVMTSEDIEYKGSIDLGDVRGEIVFENVSYAYPDKPNVEVVKGLNLHIKPGECIAFVGASGSGKSTVMNMILGFLAPTQGKIFIDGKDLHSIDLHRYRRHISAVPQNSILFQGTVRDNITYGLDSITDEDVARVIKLANIEEFLPQLPDGINSDVGEGGDKLSGGQRQRITIARAIIRNPAILVLDEATSALDNVSEYHVQKAIETLISGRTTFIVAHRLSTIRNADRIVVMDGGRCVEIGTYTELMEKKGKFFELKTLSDITLEKEASI